VPSDCIQADGKCDDKKDDKGDDKAGVPPNGSGGPQAAATGQGTTP